MTPMQWTPISSRAAWRGLGLLSLVGGLAAAAGDAGAEEPAQKLVTDFAITVLEIQKAPTTFKFQSRISQAKMPVGNQQFTKIIVNLVRGGSEVLCREELVNVMVRDSVLNLDIGRGFTCALEDIIAKNADLSFQICLNREENCLKPVALASVPFAVKASLSHQAEHAYKADVAAQCHYAHRVTADLGLLDPANRDVIGAGYYDFQTTPGDSIDPASTVVGSDTASEGFFQWAPTAAASGNAAQGKLHMCMRAVTKEDQETLTDLESLDLHAQTTTAHGRLLVGPQVGSEAGQLVVKGASYLDGLATVTGRATVGESLDVTGATTLRNTLDVTGATTLRNNLDVTGKSTLTDATVTGATTLNTLSVHQAADQGFAVDATGKTTFYGDVEFARTPGMSLKADSVAWHALNHEGTAAHGSEVPSAVTALEALNAQTCAVGAHLTWTGTAYLCTKPLLPPPPTAECGVGELVTWNGSAYVCAQPQADKIAGFPATCAAGQHSVRGENGWECSPFRRTWVKGTPTFNCYSLPGYTCNKDWGYQLTTGPGVTAARSGAAVTITIDNMPSCAGASEDTAAARPVVSPSVSAVGYRQVLSTTNPRGTVWAPSDLPATTRLNCINKTLRMDATIVVDLEGVEGGFEAMIEW